MRVIRFTVGLAVCSIALFLPYQARTGYNRLIAKAAHAPFILFGLLAGFLLRQTEESPPAKTPR